MHITRHLPWDIYLHIVVNETFKLFLNTNTQDPLALLPLEIQHTVEVSTLRLRRQLSSCTLVQGSKSHLSIHVERLLVAAARRPSREDGIVMLEVRASDGTGNCERRGVLQYVSEASSCVWTCEKPSYLVRFAGEVVS